MEVESNNFRVSPEVSSVQETDLTKPLLALASPTRSKAATSILNHVGDHINDSQNLLLPSFADECLDDINTALNALSVTSSLMFGMVLGLMFRNPIAESYQADFNNAICNNFEARAYVVQQLEKRNVPTMVKFADDSELDIKKELFLSDPDGKCGKMFPSMSIQLNNCLHDVYKSDPNYFPLASNSYVDPFCHASGHFLASKTYLGAMVDQTDFRTWAHSKWPGHAYPYDNEMLMAGTIASVTLALTLFGSLIFYFTVTLSRAREDESKVTLRRFSTIAGPALLVLFLSLMIGLFFSIAFLLDVLALRVSSFIVSYQISNLFTVSLAVGSTLLTVWASAAFIYSHEYVWSRSGKTPVRKSWISKSV